MWDTRGLLYERTINNNKKNSLTSSSSRKHFLRVWPCALPSVSGWGGFAPFSSSKAWPPRRWLASGGCGNELFVLIFPVNLWYSEAIIGYRSRSEMSKEKKQLTACQRRNRLWRNDRGFVRSEGSRWLAASLEPKQDKMRIFVFKKRSVYGWRIGGVTDRYEALAFAVMSSYLCAGARGGLLDWRCQ